MSFSTAIPDGVKATDELLAWHAARHVLATVRKFEAGYALELLGEALAGLQRLLDPIWTFCLGSVELAELFDVGNVVDECS